MSELNCIAKSLFPVTRNIIADDLRVLGVKSGETLLVHSSLSSLGWVVGGAVVVIQALLDVIGDDGTLIMPAQTSSYSDPAGWKNPPVPEDWFQSIRDCMPAFEPDITPTFGMGIIPEVFRKFPRVLRSSHPLLSFVAKGANAEYVTSGHSLNYGLGNDSPLGKIYELDGKVLMLGTDYNTCTSLHLGEVRAGNHQLVSCGAPILQGGVKIWKEYNDIDYSTQFFSQIGNEFENDQTSILSGNVGMARSKLFSQVSIVDFAVSWLTTKKKR